MDYTNLMSQALKRQESARGKSAFKSPEGRMVGGVYVAPNPLEYLSEALRSAGAGREAEMAGQEIQGYETQRTEGNQKALAEFLRQSQGVAASEGMPANEMDSGMDMGAVKAQAPNMQGAYASLMQAPDQSMRQMGMQGMVQLPQIQAQQQEREENRAFRTEESKLAREARAQELQQRMTDARASQAERLQAQKELREMQIQAQKDTQRMIAANRPAPQLQTLNTDQGMLERVNGKWVASIGPDGKPIAGKVAGGAEKPLTESQAKGSLYLGQMRTANNELDKLEAKGEKASPVGVAAAGSTWTNWLASKDAQKVAQLENQWSEGFLRAKTGAAATSDEVALNRRTFFPVVGDGPDVIAQKKVMRRQAEKDMEIVSGKGAERAGGASGSWDASPVDALLEKYK